MKHLILLSFFLLCFSCDTTIGIPDNEMPSTGDTLPEATTTGANTFGCRLNGEVWVPKGGSFSTPRLDVYYGNIFKVLMVDGNTLTSDGTESVTLNAQLEGLGEYPLLPESTTVFGLLDCGLFHRIDTLSPHKVMITKFDTENKIVSGEFFFTAINKDCNDTIKVTDGRFDVVFST